MTRDDSDALVTLAQELVDKARQRGADVAEAMARSGWELSARVRLGEPELVEEAGHRSVSLRVLRDQRAAVTGTSDLTDAGLERVVEDAIMLLDLSEPDPFAGPADPDLLCAPPHPDLELFDPAVEALDASEAISRAITAERAARDHDARITLSEGAAAARTVGTTALVLSSGFTGALRGSYASITATPVAEDTGGKRRRGFYWSAARHLDALEPPEAVGEEAARRTLAKLGAKKVETTQAPVIFDHDVSRSIVGTLAGCALGSAVWRKSTYLLDREGTRVASDLVTIVDDPLLPRAPGSRPYDGEGLRTRRNVMVEKGTLKTFLLDTYSARKLDRSSTASAGRSGGSISPTTSNLHLLAGSSTRDAIIASTERGLLVTEMMGFGFNPVTGDFSRGATGFWIENGEIAFPVSEVTVSSTLDDMLKGIDAVADDLDTKTATAAPTFRIAAMTIAGT